jgi:hypothetical protein
MRLRSLTSCSAKYAVIGISTPFMTWLPKITGMSGTPGIRMMAAPSTIMPV